MRRSTRKLLINFSVYAVLVTAGIIVLGLLEQHAQSRTPFHWGIFIGQFVIFLVLIDVPLVMLGIWIVDRLNTIVKLTMTETLERALPIATHLFIEHWDAEREAGRLPVVLVKPEEEAP